MYSHVCTVCTYVLAISTDTISHIFSSYYSRIEILMVSQHAPLRLDVYQNYGGREGHGRITDQRNTVSDSTVSEWTLSDSTVSDSTVSDSDSPVMQL